MKNLFATIAIICLLSTIANAKIWRMNNNTSLTPLITTDFLPTVNLQQAHDSAKVQNGDTIHLEQSTVNYGSCVFTKRIILIGSGYFLNETNPNTQVNTSQNSLVTQLQFTNPGCAGSQVLGLEFTGICYFATSNLTMRNCRVPNIYLGSSTNICDNITIAQSFITNSSYTWCILDNGATAKCSNLRITGNIVSGNYYGISLGANWGGIMKNNIFYGAVTPVLVYNMYVVNNIFSAPANVANAFYNCVVEYNLGSTNMLINTATRSNTVLGPGNLINPTLGFVVAGTTDGLYQLQPSSPAKATGKGGVDMGAFAGDYPYRLSGLAPIPNIYQLSIAPIAPAASTMSVTVSSKSNN